MLVSLFLSPGRLRRPPILALALAVGTAFCLPVAPPFIHSSSAAEIISVRVRERLSRYGAWETSRRYGEVWVPSVDTRWRPYTVGHWVWTDDGWYWQSDEPFGEIVFHYGRWVYDPDLGWVWIEGDEWAPAWVVWRESDDDVGWVPAPPPDVDVVVEDNWWCFVPVAAIGAANLVTVVRPVIENRTLIENTTIINQKVVINEGQKTRTVRIGKQTIPINAGPRLAALPAQVVSKVRAARIEPPKKGSFSAAHLDMAQGAALKKKAVELKPAATQPANPKGIAPKELQQGNEAKGKALPALKPSVGPQNKPASMAKAKKPGSKPVVRQEATTAKTATAKTAVKTQVQKRKLAKRRTVTTAGAGPQRQIRHASVYKAPKAMRPPRAAQMRPRHPAPMRHARPAARPAPRHPACGPRNPRCRKG
jgi:hypothetical protein